MFLLKKKIVTVDFLLRFFLEGIKTHDLSENLYNLYFSSKVK